MFGIGTSTEYATFPPEDIEALDAIYKDTLKKKQWAKAKAVEKVRMYVKKFAEVASTKGQTTTPENSTGGEIDDKTRLRDKSKEGESEDRNGQSSDA